MRRYIDADLIQYEPMLRPQGNGMYEDCEITYHDEIDNMPTADVVEVVRCNDCIRLDKGENDSECWCECTAHFGRYFEVSDDDYCSFGKRAEQ